jgi:glycosyltransferase involved in cell wall biosynthesis
VLAGVRVHRLHRVQLKYLRTVTYLSMLAGFLLARVRRYDLVHVHLANLQADIAVAAARLHGKPTYLKVAAGGPLGEVGRMRAVSWLTRYFGLRKADAVQAISDEIMTDLKSIGIPSERVVRIPNGVLVPARPAREDRSAARAALDLAEDEFVALYAGRMERYKGIGDLLAAWKALTEPRARLLLVGRAGVKDPVNLEALPSGVEHRPWTDRIDQYLAATDAFVLPSYTEGMSNALLEAMAAGVACISSRVGAAQEMIRDGESGLLFEPGDRASLASALQKLARGSDLRRTLGDAARADIARAYGIETVVDRIEAAYKRLAA